MLGLSLSECGLLSELYSQWWSEGRKEELASAKLAELLQANLPHSCFPGNVQGWASKPKPEENVGGQGLAAVLAALGKVGKTRLGSSQWLS